MKVIFEWIDFFKFLIYVYWVVECWNIILILFNVLLCVDGGVLNLKVIDFDLEIVEMVLVMIEMLGVIMVLVYMFYDIVCKLLEGFQVVLEIIGDDFILEIWVGCFKFMLQMLLEIDFLDLIVGEFSYMFFLIVGDICKLIDMIQFVILIEEICYYLNGIYFYNVDGG